MTIDQVAKTNPAEPRLPALCYGTSALGSMPDTYGYAVDPDRARQTILGLLKLEDSFIDTSRNYGLGRSEERVGDAIGELGGLPAHCILSTKLDRDMETRQFDADRAWRSLEESLKALKIDRIPILHLHDPEYASDLNDVTKKGGALDALFKMKEQGMAGAVGLAMGNLSLMATLLRDRPFDAVISHNRYTLINREADALFTEIHARGIAIFNAAPYAGGVLAKGSNAGARITYQEASEADLAPVRRIEDICRKYGISPGAAALQFSMRDPRITSTIVGVSKPERITETQDWASEAIPDEMWAELMALPFSSEDPEAKRVYKPA